MSAKKQRKKKILVIQIKRIGDSLLTLPLLRVLSEEVGVEVHLLGNKEIKNILCFCPYVDKFLGYTHKYFKPKIWLGVLRERYDLCFDVTGTERSAFLSWVVNCPKKAIMAKNLNKYPYSKFIYNYTVHSSVRNLHTIDYYLSALEIFCPTQHPISVRSDILKRILKIPKGDLVQFEESVHRRFNLDTGKKFVIIHPGAAREEKFWQVEKWVEVIRNLAAKDFICVITGGNALAEKEHIMDICAYFSSHEVFVNNLLFDLSGKLTMEEFFCLVQLSDLVISVDTSIVHIASLLSKPQIALFGLTNPYHWRPRHDKAIVIQASKDEFLTNKSEKFSPRHDKKPMSEISPKIVFSAIDHHQ